MNTSRNWFFHLVVAGLCAFTGMVQAQNPEPAPTPPPVSVEAPDTPAVETPATETPDVEAPDNDGPNIQWSASEGWRHRHHSNNDRVVVGGNATLDKGQEADTVVSVFGSSTSDGDVSDAVVSVIGDTRVTGTARDVVAVLGSVYLNGKASGDVVATLGDVELGPNAEVGGEVVVVGGTLKRDPKAIIHGGVQNVLSFVSGSFDWLRPWARNCLLLGRPLAIAPGLGWAWGLALGFLGLYVLIALLFRPAVDRCVQTLEEQPGRTVVAALLTTLLTPVMFALLFITIIGIVFVPIAALGVFLIGLFGKAVVLAWIGRSILKLSGQVNAQLHTVLAVIAGGIVVTILYLVPFVGFIVWKVLGFLGLGVAALSLIQSMKKRGDSGPAAAMAGTPGGGASSTFSEPSFGDGQPSDAPGNARASDAFGSANPTGSSGAPRAYGSAGASAFGPGGEPGAAGAGHTYGTSDASSSSAPDASGAGSAGTSDSGSSGAGPSDSSTSGGGVGGRGHGGGTGGFGGFRGAGRAGTIDPATAVTYPRAGFGVRMAALFIDIVLIAVLLGIIDSTREMELIALATYGAIMWKLKSTTIGGIVFGLQVVRVDGRPIDWATSTVRALSCFLSLVVGGLGFIWIAFDEGHQAWHDKIAGTAVVRVPKGVSLL